MQTVNGPACEISIRIASTRSESPNEQTHHRLRYSRARRIDADKGSD